MRELEAAGVPTTGKAVEDFVLNKAKRSGDANKVAADFDELLENMPDAKRKLQTLADEKTTSAAAAKAKTEAAKAKNTADNTAKTAEAKATTAKTKAEKTLRQELEAAATASEKSEATNKISAGESQRTNKRAVSGKVKTAVTDKAKAGEAAEKTRRKARSSANTAALEAKKSKAEAAKKEQTRKAEDSAKKVDSLGEDLRASIAKVESTPAKASDGVLAQYADKPNTTIEKLLSSRDSYPELQALKKAMSEGKKGAEFDSHVMSEVMRKISKSEDAANRLTAKSIREFSDMTETLVKSGVLPKAQADTISKRLAKHAETKTMRKNAEKVDPLEAREKMADNASLMVAGRLGKVASKLSGGGSLMVMSKIRRTVREMLTEGGYSKQLIKDTESLLSDPKKLAEVLGDNATDMSNAERANNIRAFLLTGKVADKATDEQEQEK